MLFSEKPFCLLQYISFFIMPYISIILLSLSFNSLESLPSYFPISLDFPVF